MKGLVKFARGAGHMETREVGEPVVDEGTVVIEVEAAGICGSDLHIFDDDIAIPIRVPVVVGHEFSGRIAEVGKGAGGANLRMGDPVTAMPSVQVCGVCRYCRQGDLNLCVERRSMGYWHNGSFAPRVSVPLRCVRPVPPGIRLRVAALAEPLACAVHAVSEVTRVSAGDLVVIVGPGPIGLLCQQVAMAEGGRVAVFGTVRDGHRLELAAQLGAEVVSSEGPEAICDRVRDLSDGYGADVVFECSGSGAGVGLALELVRKQGQLTQVGLLGKPASVDFEQVAFKEVVVTGSMGQRVSSWQRALHLAEIGAVDLEALITHEISVDEWESAFELVRRGEGIKILLDVRSK